MERRAFLAAASASAVSGLAGCSALGSNSDGSADVSMRAVVFDPEEYTVEVGDEVVWDNPSTRAHTVTAYEDAIPSEADYFASGGFDGEAAAREAWEDDFGGAVRNGETYSHTFEVPGRYEYVCIPHEQGGMVGTIVVEE